MRGMGLMGLMLLLAGCAARGVRVGLPPVRIQETPSYEGPAVYRDVPPLPNFGLPGARNLPGVAVVPPARGRRVVLDWTNYPAPAGWSATNYYTVVEATGDFVHWAEVARLPYESRGQVALTNGPEAEFYRAGNGVR